MLCSVNRSYSVSRLWSEDTGEELSPGPNLQTASELIPFTLPNSVKQTPDMSCAWRSCGIYYQT